MFFRFFPADDAIRKHRLEIRVQSKKPFTYRKLGTPYFNYNLRVPFELDAELGHAGSVHRTGRGWYTHRLNVRVLIPFCEVQVWWVYRLTPTGPLSQVDLARRARETDVARKEAKLILNEFVVRRSSRSKFRQILTKRTNGRQRRLLAANSN